MSSSIANKLSRNPYLTDNETQFLITEMQGLRDDVSIADENDIYIPFADEIRLRGESHTVRQHLTGTTPKAENRTRQATRTETTMLRKVSSGGKSYPLIHTTFGSLTFPTAAASHKYGGGALFDGSSRIEIDNSARLNPTDEITFGGWFFIKSSVSNQTFISKSQQYFLRQTNDVLEGAVYIGSSVGTLANFSVAGLVDTWIHIWITWKSPNLKIYVNGVLRKTVTRSGVLDTTTNKLVIGAAGAASSEVLNGHTISWVTMLNKEVSLSWITDNMNGILDTNAMNEITTIPFVGDELARPETTFGIAI